MSAPKPTYPWLELLPAAEQARLLRPEARVKVPAGAELFTERQPCQGFPLLLDGKIKVVKTAASGREMLLYRVLPGGSCIITSSCLLGHTAYNARGIAETPLELVLLSAAEFDRLLLESPEFRQFVFHLFGERLAELMERVEELAFHRLDQRLARLLLRHSEHEPLLRTTHQTLAEELGSVREIVSRLLKGFANDGLVELGREQIRVLDRERLQQIAQG